ncbi:hypothetical protein [Lactiplantibacillus plantarum]|uniref:hypothetical protein n=1 Tax=Lactiplantibacillus plantarum TaxID=1590 RepID=UPI00106D3A6D|nr:hypothetical protein [Lactiplantibacillus plantarum]MDN3985712.1 hypothetical protein [Lactiplantibacillus plantarum]VFI63650.1 hypothetical protein LAP9571_02872 [Lactiplantibacillus plantarum]VFI64339.1 hypothetical protein LAP9492_03070 [Lactiplantibacillus plantarum]
MKWYSANDMQNQFEKEINVKIKMTTLRRWITKEQTTVDDRKKFNELGSYRQVTKYSAKIFCNLIVHNMHSIRRLKVLEFLIRRFAEKIDPNNIELKKMNANLSKEDRETRELIEKEYQNTSGFEEQYTDLEIFEKKYMLYMNTIVLESLAKKFNIFIDKEALYQDVYSNEISQNTYSKYYKL